MIARLFLDIHQITPKKQRSLTRAQKNIVTTAVQTV